MGFSAWMPSTTQSPPFRLMCSVSGLRYSVVKSNTGRSASPRVSSWLSTVWMAGMSRAVMFS